MSEKGQQAFAASHQVFFDWDKEALSNLTPDERDQLMNLLYKALAAAPGPVRCKNIKTPRTVLARGVILFLKVVRGLFKDL